jgi:hypothetical protein
MNAHHQVTDAAIQPALSDDAVENTAPVEA